MRDLLSHLSHLTTHRDHHHLDMAMLKALTAMVGCREARIFDIHQTNNELTLRQRIALKNGQFIVPQQHYTDACHQGDPLTQFPALQTCIEQHQAMAHDVAPDGSCLLWLPIWIDDHAQSGISLNAAVPYDSTAMATIHGMMDIYANYQSLLDYSQRDSLTGLLNRKTFDDDFSRMVSAPPPKEAHSEATTEDRRHEPSGREHWLAVVDIDHFKLVNDKFGHLYGDEVLILIANLLRSSFRSHDRVFRFGGEEFVILLRSVTLTEARRILERFRAQVEQYNFPQVGRVTVSLGFSSIHNDTPVEILGHADQALYFAKENGRNQVCHYDALVEAGHLQSQVTNDSVEFFFDSPSP